MVADMEALNPSTMRYIKLGQAGAWENISLDRGELHFGFAMVPHELALSGDRPAIKQHLVRRGRSSRTAADDVREILDFYTLGPDCLWFTIARGQLWWARADATVHWLGGDGKDHGSRIRKSIDGWHNKDRNGNLLRLETLSTRLTKCQAYRRTICTTESADYLIRRIQGIDEPIAARAKAVAENLVQVTAEAIALLHWVDFETLVDLVFARTGWNRTSPLGGTQATVDLILEQAATGETAMVQVKSAADQCALDECITAFEKAGTYDRAFFVCHSPATKLTGNSPQSVHVWTQLDLARRVVSLGLQSWVIHKVG